MKTTIDIPDNVLSDAIRYTKAKTKKDAVLDALEDYIRRQKVVSLTASFGTWDMESNTKIETADLAESKRVNK